MSERAPAEQPASPVAKQSEDRLVCAEIARRHARTFALASRFLQPAKRRAAFALYAFCRGADDIVDEAGDATITVRRERLDGFGARLDRALLGEPDDAPFRELWWAVGAFHVPAPLLHELLDGVARDLEPVRYETWDVLASYCGGVASSVGEMCALVFGVSGGADARERARRHARTLGVAMQLTNILRDIGEDSRRGRCYLPLDELRRFGLSADEVISDPHVARRPGWTPFMQHQIARARGLYADAARGIPLIERDARRCAAACADGYSSILTAIERLDYDTVTSRPHVSTLGRVGVLWRAWLGAPPPHIDSTIADSDDAIKWA